MSYTSRTLNSSAGQVERWQPSPHILVQRMGDEIVLFHRRTSLFYKLNRTGARFWDLLVSGHAMASIEEQLFEQFDVDADQLKGEIESTLELLMTESLISAVEEEQA